MARVGLRRSVDTGGLIMSGFRFMFINAIDTVQGSDNYPPLGIGYMISMLRSRFGDDFIEFKSIEDEIDDEIRSFKPDIVGISSVSPNFNRAIEYAKTAKKYDLPVIVGGVHITMLPESLTGDMDIGVLGEGEETICELVELFKEGDLFDEARLMGVKGIVFRSKEGVLRTTPRRKLIDPLDSIPMTSRDTLQINQHTYMFTSRGCPYKCIFCSSHRYWDKVRLHSAEYVVDEIEFLVNEYNVKSIYFCDDIFVISVRRTEEILRLLKERGLLGKVSFTCACRSNMVNEKNIEVLRELGVTLITMGFESGCDKTLAYLKDSQMSVETHKRAIRIIRENDIEVMGGFIIGAPEESREDIENTIEFIKRNRLVNASIYPLTPLPGTPLWDYARKRNLVDDKMDWDLLSFTEFLHDVDITINLSESLSREDLFGYIQSFRSWRRATIFKSLIKEAMMNPFKIPEVTLFFVEKMKDRVKRWSLARKPAH
jgi:radical SAM superfamily enzyme YgiQ (UPF0313 family)